MRDLVIIGAGGFGREVRRWARDKHNIVGFVNSNELPQSGCIAVVTIGDPATRRKVVEETDATWAYALYPDSADIADLTFIDKGTIICQNVIITVNARIGKHVHLNFASTIGHDCIIGDFVTISPGVHISGNVTIGDEVFIGTGALIREKLTIGKGAVIGMGAVVVKDVPAGVTVVGNPAKEMK